jgi:hypothetical protein
MKAGRRGAGWPAVAHLPTVDVLALRHPLQWDGGDGGTMAKKDAASKRLAQEIAFAELVKKVPPLFTEEDLKKVPPRFTPEELPPPAPEELPPPAPEELPALLRLGVSWSLLLGSYGKDAVERSILDAFQAFGLDHRSLSDWRALVSHLAHVLFPTPRPSGAPRKWTDERLCKLLADVAAYKRKNPEASDVAICIWLKKKWPKHSPERLRRVLQDARNPARNDLLARTAYGLLTQQMLREAAAAPCGVTEDAPWSWTGVDEKTNVVLSRAMRAAVWKAIEEADKLWGD